MVQRDQNQEPDTVHEDLGLSHSAGIAWCLSVSTINCPEDGFVVFMVNVSYADGDVSSHRWLHTYPKAEAKAQQIQQRQQHDNNSSQFLVTNANQRQLPCATPVPV
ncbi:LOW QUALITY PROTEIN: hypothetical protein FGSG_13918 [Fusarium graminearum PH-1]|uniref:hypothetical protein n=1 Tax=Gibberella zeae (strain ATCC MYA-4620 / CBS 123657 / FGSC 9075 / NRRL 31084 / PH-1) TaxID=229533 RepID=UPI00021F23BC|nr:LOW QUALITY PROTEIN: hypothetical protein FGSG_13918 [Fusarium graminearum PH-1]ESU17982.1 LOW QUALITY PROTEIN: hypothetical protein FGSG_13918 [Fusarium graminearum PH-1]|eukprot:XP_011325604.1 LOW QUALITY PROTEIN: hypothetical protein FGSG_13918 [Fusarium graminearum PH-1]